MKSGYKRLLLFEIIIIIISLFLNSFVSNILRGYLPFIFILITLIVFKYVFGFEKDNHRYWKSICIELIIYLLVFFILYYLLGIIIHFVRTNNSWTFSFIIWTILPIILTIIVKEILRYMMLTKSEDSKLLLTTTCLLFIFIDLIGKFDLSSFETLYSTFMIFALYILPAVSKSVLCSYISYKGGYKPAIMYLLIMSLWTYIIPIIPNPNEYIYAVIEFVTPFIYLFFLNNYLKKDNDEEVSRKKHRKSFGVLIGPALLVIILVYFTSGLFHYHAIAIASGSMTPKILKGDVVVVEKVEPNTLEVGQVIAYRRDNSIIVHRLIKILTVGDEIFYYTQGDANDFVDNCKITKDMIIGVVDLRIPFIGYPTVWLNNL